MYKNPPVFLISGLWLGLVLPALALPPVAVLDRYTVDEDTLLEQGSAGGVLANDIANGAALEAVLVSPPAHGSVVLQPDGSFLYTPAAEYSGPDSFTYQARTVPPPVVFTVDQAQSRMQMTASLTTTAGSATDKGDSRLAGTVSASLTPAGTPFSAAQITDVNVRMIDKIDLDFGLGCFLNICLARIGVVTRTVPADQMTLTMSAPGTAGPVTAGVFSQPGNSTRLRGVVDVTASGAAAGQVPDGPQTLDAVTDVDLANCQIASNGTTLTLKVPVTYTGRFFIDPLVTNTNYVDATLRTAFTGSSGFIVATAPASANVPELSSPVTVEITVAPVDDEPVALPDAYFVRQGGSLVVPASAAVDSSDLVATGAEWRYHYEGTEPGAAWRQWSFDDSGWQSGVAPHIFTGAAAAARTAYFRREFPVVDPAAVRGLRVRLLRDDGAAVYLNGREVVRDNLPAAPAALDSNTAALTEVSGAEESEYQVIDLPLGGLFPGGNVIAVEVHRAEEVSPDLRFDLVLKQQSGVAGVLANDSDIDTALSALAVAVASPPAQGALTLAADGGFSWTPPPAFSGGDSFVYQITGGGVDAAQALVPRGSVWKYQANGTDEGVVWATPVYDDSAWLSGAAELGYGDTADGRPEVTNIRPQPQTQAIYPTYYFRHRFDVDFEPSLTGSLTGRILRDDAAAVYLNGVEIYRDANLPAAAGFSVYATAQTPSETVAATFSIPAGSLHAGENLLAVEVHQAGLDDPDVSFDFELTARVRTGARVALTVSSDDEDADGVSDIWERANGLRFEDPADAVLDADGDGQSNRAEFLALTDPQNASAFLRADGIQRTPGGTDLTFQHLNPALTYQVDVSPDCVGWIPLGTPWQPAAAEDTRSVPAGTAREFYRLRVLRTWP